MSEDRVQIDVADGVADVRMVRADKHNALDWPMFQALDGVTDELAERDDVRCVVLSGEGPSFCSGLDFPSFMAGDVGVDEMISEVPGEVANIVQRVSYDWQRLPMPVIAAIHGNCLGGGAQIALGADIRISARELKLCVMEIKYGLIPDMGITQVLPALVGLDVAKEIVFSGRTIGAEEALALGLVTRVSDNALGEAKELAAQIASKSPHAIRSGKRLLNEAYTGRKRGRPEARGRASARPYRQPEPDRGGHGSDDQGAGEFVDP